MEKVRLINKDALMDDSTTTYISGEGYLAMWRIEEFPEIAPESLRPTGRWILTNEDYEYLTCSVCGGAYYTGAETFARAQDHLTFAGGYKYCPNCGAKMEG